MPRLWKTVWMCPYRMEWPPLSAARNVAKNLGEAAKKFNCLANSEYFKACKRCKGPVAYDKRTS
jgi:hypothetical protein